MFADDTTNINADIETSPLITQDLKNMTNGLVPKKLTGREVKGEPLLDEANQINIKY